MSETLARHIWHRIGGSPQSFDRLELTGPRTVLPSSYDVTGLAVASVAAATLGVADAIAPQSSPPLVRVNSLDACSSFLSERRLTPLGWDLPPAWDAIAGNYRTADGWIRLHTNYSYHREAALAALGLPEEANRFQVAAAVRQRKGEELEQAVVDADGCAAMMRTGEEWIQHPAGLVAAGMPTVEIRATGAPTTFEPRPNLRLGGLRVVDITRVIAGPMCTRFLAGYGADVLRIDPPGFDEVGALLPLTTEGKRCAVLDISTEAGRGQLFSLLEDAHVLVHGLRPGALDRLGLGHDRLVEQFPHLVIGRISAYGTKGPWGRRHGFDSLVQMSSGLAVTETERSGSDEPSALPVQGLDHATGYLLAAGILRLLASRQAGIVSTALAATAHLLSEHRTPDPGVTAEPSLPALVTRSSAWGRLLSTPVPGYISGVSPDLRIPAGPLGRYDPRWR
ncbi:acyl-CoA transferase [Nocardioides humilatus]|uniref:Acyl-CoA transferase n=1 Tax=Nocardioides humilatus TaxID=2607660 RepID=A0A5B1LQS5_9ACTN|nr:CoA transferase [Nocardioides humilatus]KAA1421957.1 acyl-CoA transferase [Nocardioides humilatus]